MNETPTYRLLLIVPSDQPLPELFDGVDYHQGWKFEDRDAAENFVRAAMDAYPDAIVGYELRANRR